MIGQQISKNNFFPIIIIRYIIGAIKFPLFVVLFMVLLLCYQITFFIPLQVYKNCFRRIFSYFTTKVMLILLGYGKIHQKLSSTEIFGENGDFFDANPGDIIISNMNSYINLIWLQFEFRPIFVIPINKDQYIIKSFFGIFIDHIGLRDSSNGNVSSWDDVLIHSKNNQGPIIVFPEKRPSNGVSLREFVDLPIEEWHRSRTVHMIGFHHEVEGLSPCFVQGDGLLHLMQMLGRINSQMTVYMIDPSDTLKCRNSNDLRTLLNQTIDTYDEQKNIHMD